MPSSPAALRAILSSERHQLDLAHITGLETGGGGGGDVQALSSGGGAVESQGAIHVGEVEVRAHLDRAVTGIRHG
jgi:hypothetical protein